MAELIVAFDVSSGREALALAGRLPGLRWAKIGPVLFGREGPSLIKEFTQRGVRVFLDLKWHDIPSIVASAVAAARELGVSMTTVHCLGGRAMLTAAARAGGAGGGPDLAVVGVTVLTSHDAAELEGVLGRGVPDVGFEAERLARAALQAGLRGVVASGQELGLLREALGPEPWIVVPGIRAPADAAGDQVRTIEPAEAVRRGATHLVVGRPITTAADPVAAYRRLVEALD
ncbi:MAG TPA: orotidine-5'-phosphate decarboxylase [Gemmatimonadales bacterium]|nr:orotidine-5'-phosphate decarboxylase [Gemmatimonadales bacterium]